MSLAVRLTGVSKPPLRDVSFEVEHGETVILSGPRGTGKHLILELILGLQNPESGTVEVMGKDLANLHHLERRRLRIPVALVPVEGPLLSNLSVFDNVALPLRYHLDLAANEVDTRVRSVLAKMGLEELGPVRPWQLSISQRRLASLARARLMRPQLLLLEDVFVGMGDAESDLVSATVSEMVSGGCATILTTHGTRLETFYDGRLLKLPDVRVVPLGGA